MRRVRYSVAASLDGYIADKDGRFDWIPHDPTVDFGALFANVDTLIMGRLTYEVMRSNPEPPFHPGTRVYVFSQSLPTDAAPGITVVRDDPVAFTSSLRHESGTGEIWLFGGGQLFATLLAGHQVDSVEIAVVPVLLGEGLPLVAPLGGRSRLQFVHSHVYPSGIVALHYAVPAATA